MTWDTHVSAATTAMDVIKRWNPPATPHCSNCLHCVVNGVWPSPIARCEMGHGSRAEIRLVALQRKSGKGFAQAAKCPDWSSMDDDLTPLPNQIEEAVA